MSLVIYFMQYALNLHFTDWLHLTILPKLAIFAIICIFALVTFVLCAKLTGVLNIKEIMAHLLKKELSDATGKI